MCAECSEAFTKGINDLLADPAKHTWVGGVTFIFWTREEVEFSFLEFLQQPRPEEVKGLLESARTGSDNRKWTTRRSTRWGSLVVGAERSYGTG